MIIFAHNLVKEKTNMITIIAAVARNRAIGFDNRLIYRLPNDMKRFRQLTTGHTVVMGRRTFESLPNGALPNRRNIVLSRTTDGFPGCDTYQSLSEALAHLPPDDDIYIIGGACVYRQALALADRLCLTEVDDTPAEADTFFPDYSDWREVWREDHPADERHAYPYSFVDYVTKECYRLPAEWEPQSGVQLTWPHAETDWAPMLDEITETYQRMAAAISRYEPLLIVGPPTNDTWARDHGFITLVSTSGKPRLLDFKFNGWGEKFPAELDNAINRRLYDEGRVGGEYVDCQDFVLEGGSIESDGRGTVFTTSQCLLAPRRNQPLTREQIEDELKNRLCARRVVWIDHGRLTGDDTDGHIDTLVRVAPDDTLLYVGCDDPHDEQYHELQLMEEQLMALRTIDGTPYRLLRLPMPRPILDEDGQRLPATYANFLVVNGAVICPTYAQPDLDGEAMTVIAQAFPGRDVVGIDCRSVVRQHGSLHCCTMQFPEAVTLRP